MARPRIRSLRCAFTLIELLLVIAISAVLLALLVPALAHARSQARVVQCLALVRGQVGLVSLYAADFKEALPPRLVWITADEASGTPASAWLINRLLAQYSGERFTLSEDGIAIPSSAWRCTEVKDDAERLAHEGILHFAPNLWLFNDTVVNQSTHSVTVNATALDGWDQSYGHTWRRMSQVPDPGRIIALIDNVNYYETSEGVRRARTAIGYASDVALPGELAEPSRPDNRGSHDSSRVRPAACIDGHAEAVSSAPQYWLNDVASYAPRGSEGVTQLHQREVERLMWFISPGDRVTDD